MSDDEDDYMSDKYLQNDNRPGLMPDMFMKKHKRVESALVRGKQKKTKPLKVTEAEKREEKLNTALDESNKGFALLSKMGFKKGMGLGKEGTGRKEPIPLEVKSGRGGVGKSEHDNRQKRQRVEMLAFRSKRKKELEDNLRGDFCNRMKDKAFERKTLGDLNQSQKACEQLDTAKGLEAVQPWYWPKPIPSQEEEEEEYVDDEEYEEPDIYDQLHLITHYLRITHLYCIWCGTTFNDADDLNSNCPGDTHEAHDDI